MLYKKSLLCMEKEKMWVLNKELRYLYLICDFYDVEDSSLSSEKKDLEHSFHILKEQIEDLQKNIKNNFESLKKEIKRVEKLKMIHEIQSLIYINMLREYIKYLVTKIDLISIKISQLLKDGYNQYLPKPIVGKRHSSINITSQAEFSLKKRLYELRKNNNKTIEPIIVWDYNDEYNIINDYKNSIVFNLSYWYFEFSYFLPNLTHEIGHYLQKDKEKNSNTKKLKNIIDNEMKNFISYLVKKEEKQTKNLSEHLAEEIIADLTALLYHGSSYIYALTHKTLGYKLANNFRFLDYKNEVYNKNYKIIDMHNVKINSSFLIKNYRFNLSRDLIFIRLYVLLALRDIILTNKLKQNIFDGDSSNIKELERLLNSIYHINKNIKFDSNISSSLDDIYKDYHHTFDKNYTETKKIIETLYHTIISFFEKNQDIIKTIDSSNKSEEKSKYTELPTYFNDIWNKRFDALKENKTIHHFEYRKKLHKVTLEKLIKDGLLDENNILPYSMVFVKFRIDKLDTQPTDFKKELKQGRVLGIYDYVYFRKLTKRVEVNKFYLFQEEKDEQDRKYYESSYSLMKILNDTKGDDKARETNGLNTIIQVEVSKKLDEFENRRDIYENLYQNLIDIYTIFEKEFKDDKKEYFKIEYFKSLGPKDIIICIDSATINFIFKAKKALYQKFRRTFTTFYLNTKINSNINYSTIVSTKKNPFVSYLRMDSNYDNDAFEKKCKEYKKYIKIIFLKTGVMDFRMVWNSGVSLKILNKFYEEILEQNMVSDIQTSIDEHVML